MLHFGVVARPLHDLLRDGRQGSLMAVGTPFADGADPDQHREHEGRKQRRDGQHAPQGKIVLRLGREVEFAPFDPHGRSGDARHHAPVVIALAEAGQHVFELNAFADRIGQHALQPAARDEADFAPILHEQDAEAVVDVGAPHAPRAEQLDGEREDVVRGDVVHRHDRHLREVAFAQRSAQRIDARHGAGRQDPVGIRDVPPSVGALHVGDLLRTVGARRGRPSAEQQKTKENRTFHRGCKHTKKPAKTAANANRTAHPAAPDHGSRKEPAAACETAASVRHSAYRTSTR